MKTTVKDLLHAVNILGVTRDIFVDGIDSIGVVPPIKMTNEGRQHFKEALEAQVEVVYENDAHEDTYISDCNDEANNMAWKLLCALAGYCGTDDFRKWFELDAEIL